ncbi:chemotaxis protein CheY [Pontibacillus halophilus JSM 076056 = DSM 19796]|uniref:Protein-glutamate methylesterase/protein-glutamine glutaminase n=1 Tax=Pontibacillus halophilus JSM 076056 = DSM 19796 TaxID=1385510 RepID=A0A0A5GPI1_9BACI|nr:chemotaxis response regulator protein-glutamate methylesterase [Pontibacillus halophilus]KGX93153.1 chemotaxis protein CheY [Pontibacillus halophilus JSM 076056 = DSM 19796]
MKPIRVLIIDDSAFMRKMIANILEEDSRIIVVGKARNGQDGLNKISECNPDVVTMDVEMPVMDGLTALERIMKEAPLPVIMLSSLTHSGAEATVRAMEAGAFDFIPKPSGSISLDIEQVKNELIQKVLEAVQANLQEIKKAPPKPKVVEPFHREAAAPKRPQKKLIAIGTSTGGPRALQQVLTQLPEDLPAPVLIVQHMPAGFTKSLANRLDAMCNIRVKEAEQGELLMKGTAYLAPGDYHLSVKRAGMALAVHLDQSPPMRGHRPSVDTLFRSLTTMSHYEIFPIVMTGMGADGAQGLTELYQQHPAITSIVEHESTAVVYGMPKACWKTGYVDYEIPVTEISQKVRQLLGDKG